MLKDAVQESVSRRLHADSPSWRVHAPPLNLSSTVRDQRRLTCAKRAHVRWIASDKSTRIPLSTFQTALSIHQIDADADEVECMVANMVFRVSRVEIAAFARAQRSLAGLYERVYIAREANGGFGQDGAFPESQHDSTVTGFESVAADTLLVNDTYQATCPSSHRQDVSQ